MNKSELSLIIGALYQLKDADKAKIKESAITKLLGLILSKEPPDSSIIHPLCQDSCRL